jgi:hypothetical protein
MAVDLILRAACVSRSAIASEIRSKLGILSYFEVSEVVINKCEFQWGANFSREYEYRNSATDAQGLY